MRTGGVRPDDLSENTTPRRINCDSFESPQITLRVNYFADAFPNVLLASPCYCRWLTISKARSPAAMSITPRSRRIHSELMVQTILRRVAALLQPIFI